MNQDDRKTLLHTYAAFGWPEGLAILIAVGADVNARDAKGQTPLHSAAGASTGKVNELILCVAYLFDAGADIDATCDDGRNAFHQLFIWMHGDVQDIKRATRAFLDRGADVNNCDKYGFTPFSRAVQMGNGEEALQIFKGTDFDKGLGVPDKDKGLTAVHWCVVEDMMEVLKLVTSTGADLNMQDLCEGNTPLHTAVECQNVKAVSILVENKVDLNRQNLLKKTPLHLAVERHNQTIMSILLEKWLFIDNTGPERIHAHSRGFSRGRSKIFGIAPS